MSDLQTALTKALEEGKRRFLTATVQEWDDHEQIIRSPQPQTKPQPQQEKAMTFTKTGNMSKDTFDYIKLHSFELTQAQAANAIALLGYKYASVQALLTQMKKNGMIKINSAGYMFTDQTEYKPFVNPYKLAANAKLKQDKAKAKAARALKKAALKETGIAALKPDATPPAAMFAPTPAPTVLTAQTVLKQMSVGEAYALYTELAKMFGGK